MNAIVRDLSTGLFAALLAFGSVACEDDSDPSSPDAGSGPAAADGGMQVVEKPLIVVTETDSNEHRIKYLHVLSGWPADGKLDPAKAIELGENVVVHAGDGAFWAYQPEDATMQKYLIDDQLRVTRGPNISFSGLGIADFAADPVWISPERAFLIDEKSGQIVVWNPKTMELGKATPIDPSLLKRDGLDVQLQGWPVLVDGRVFMTVAWRNWKTYGYSEGAELAWFDATSDSPTLTFIKEDSCPSSVAAPYLDEAGNVYVVGDAALGFDVLASPTKTMRHQCLRRVLRGKTEFDPDFYVDVQAATGSPGFYAAHGMAANKLLVQTWDPTVKVSDIADPVGPGWYWDNPRYFKYVIHDFTTKQNTDVALPRGGVEWSYTLRLDGRNYVQDYRDDFGVDLYRVEPSGAVTPMLKLGAGNDVQYLGRL